MRAIVSGFEPIWGIKKTPSGEVAKLWAEGAIGVHGTEVLGVVLPQQFGASTEMLMAEIASFKPHFVIMYGATQHNDPVRLERFAVNVERSPMGDNTRIPVNERPVVPGGPAAYESTLPVHLLVDRLHSHGVDAKASFHAGTHTCNSLMYGVLHQLAQQPPPHPIHAGFVHVSFPNEFGVVEDEMWTTSSFSGIVKSSVALVKEMSDWYRHTYGAHR